MIASRPKIAELLAEMLPHLRRVEALSKHLSGPSRIALDAYAVASLAAQIALRREQLGIRPGGSHA
jgi:hypothetical protein